MSSITLEILVTPKLDVAASNQVVAALKTSFGAAAKDFKPIDPKQFTEAAAGATLLDKELAEMRQKLQQLESGGKNVSKAFQFNQVVDAAAKVSAAFDSILQKGSSFQAGVAELSAITGASGEGLEKMASGARALAVEFGGSATGNLDAYKSILSKLGPDIAKTPAALESMARSVNVLSTATGDNAAASVDALTTAVLQFQVPLDDATAAAATMSDMMNVMAAGAKEGASEVPQIADALKVAGVAASGAKVSFAETNAALQALAAGGKVGAEAGTALRNVLGKLGEGRFLPKDVQKELAAAGVDMRKLSDTTIPLTDRLRGLSKIQGDAALVTKLFGTENAAAASILLRSVDSIDTLTEKISGTNTAYEQAAIRQDTVSASMDRFKAKVADLAIGAFQLVGDKVSFALGAIGQVAPALTGLAAAQNLIPEGMFTKLGAGLKDIPGLLTSAGGGIKSFGASMLSFLVSPAGLAIAAIALLAAGCILLAKSTDVSTEELIKQNDAEKKLIEDQKKGIAQQEKRVFSVANLAKEYEKLGQKTNRSAAEEKRLGVIQDDINGTYPGLISSTKSFSENLGAVKTAAFNTTGELNKLNQQMIALDAQSREVAISGLKLRLQSENEKLFAQVKDAIGGDLSIELVNQISKELAKTTTEQGVGAVFNKFKLQLNEIAAKHQINVNGKLFSDLTLNATQQTALRSQADAYAKARIDAINFMQGKVEKAVEEAPPPVIAPPPDPEKPVKEIKDFTDRYLAAIKDSREALAAANTSSITDDNARALQALRTQNQKAVDELRSKRDAVLKDIEDLRNSATAKKPFEIQIDLNGNNKIDPDEIIRSADQAGKLFTTAFQGQIDAATAKGARDLADLAVQQVLASDKQVGDARIKSLQLQEATLTGSDLESLKIRGFLRLEQVRQQNKAELRETIAALPAFKQAQAELTNTILNGPAVKKFGIDPSALISEATEALVDQFAATNPLALQLQAKQNAELLKQRNEFLIQQEEAAVVLIPTISGQERARRLIEARKQFNEELELFKESKQLQQAAAIKFASAQADIENDFQRKTRVEIAATRDFLTGFRQSINDQIAGSDDRALKDKLDRIATEREEVKRALKDQLIGHEQYVQKIRELASQETEIRRQQEQKRFDLVAAVNTGIAQSFSALGKQYSDSAAVALQQYSALSALSQEELTELGLTSDDVKGKLSDAMADSAIAFASITAQAAFQGENILRASANTFIDITAKLLESQIPALVALIFGKAFAEDPLFGGIVGAVAAAALYALVGTAKSALAAVRFGDGGEVAPHLSASLGDVVPAWLTPTEIVVRAEAAQRERDVILAINQGKSSREIFMDKYSHTLVDEEGRLITQQLSSQVEAHAREIGQLGREVAEMGELIEQGFSDLATATKDAASRTKRQTAVKVSGQVGVNKGELIALLEQEALEDLSRG